MTVVDTAIAEARARGHSYVGTEHLLVALVRRRDLLLRQVGRRLPAEVATRAAFEAELDGPPPRDEELLASLGIDLDGVRAAVRRTFGRRPRPLARQPVWQSWQPWHRPRRQCRSTLARGTRLSLSPASSE